MGCTATDKYLYVMHGKTVNNNQQAVFKKIIRADLPINSTQISWKIIHSNLPNPRSGTPITSFSNYVIWFAGSGLDYDRIIVAVSLTNVPV